MQKESLFYQLLLYCLCTILVVLFVNLYAVWEFVNQQLPAPTMKILPVAAVAIFIFAVLVYYSRNKIQISEVNWPIFWSGGVLCIIALLIPDGQFPAKRVHVLEYMVLSCLVRYTMSWRLQGSGLLFFSVFVTLLFGIHDELLQGIHPSRTYGLRDMLVNGIAALGGGLIWHGGSLFVHPAAHPLKKGTRKEYKIVLAYLFWLCLSILAFVVPLTAYRQEVIPYWPLIPLSGAFVLWATYSQEIEGPLKYGCTVVNCLIYLFLIYPVTINASSYIFH